MKIVVLGLSALGALFLRNIKESDKTMAYKLDKDTQLTTQSGATFIASKDWYVTTGDDMIILEEPDKELLLVLIENKALTAQQAVEAAWKKYKPDFVYTIAQTIPGIARDGWDEMVQLIYDVPTAAGRLVLASASRRGQSWYVQLLEGTKGAFERRMAQAMTIMTSFKVPGAEEESFAGKKAHHLDVKHIKEFAAFLENARQECKIPGAALALVQNGKVIFEQGFGVCRLGLQEPVTPETLFMIGSTTKSLTTYMMAKLIDEGKFGWDTPVTQIMPGFKLGSEATTQQLLMKYMVAANTGIPRQDIEFMFNYDTATPEMRMAEMAHMQPTTGFGETFQYSNGMVSAGGYIAAHTINAQARLGEAYDVVMQSRVFSPIGMKSTTFDFKKVAQVNHAVPHGMDLNFEYIPFPVADEQWVVSLHPAGGAWSNVRDMSRYLITELNLGINPDGTCVISEENLLKRREAQTKITDKLSYGLGLMTDNDHGVQVVGHDGMTMGFTSLMFFLPEHNVGLILLTNARGAMTFTQAVRRKLMELLFDGKPQADEMLKQGLNYFADAKRKMHEEVSFAPNALWMSQFLGTYKHDSLGMVAIRRDGNEFIFDARGWQSTIGQKKEKDGTLKLILTQVPFAGLEFLPQGNNLILEMPQHKYVFERK